MNVIRASKNFDQWHYPWLFIEHVRNALVDTPDDLALANAIWDDANLETNWLNAETLLQGIAKTEEFLFLKYPSLDKSVLKLFVNSASYNWR